jgi:uncharacterized protein
MTGADLDSIFLVRLNQGFLLHAPLHGVSARINDSAARSLQSRLKHTGSSPQDELRPLFELLAAPPKRAPEDSKTVFSPVFLGIIPTRNCNSRCLYCDFAETPDLTPTMPLATAVQAVDWYTNTVRDSESGRLCVHFFGGEPMLAPQVVQAVVFRSRLLSESMNIPAEFEITTNGQYGEAWAYFLGEYFDRVVLSLDGFQEIQDLQRPRRSHHSSFESAARTARVLSNAPADLCLRVCVSSMNIGRLPEIVDWLCESYPPTRIDMEIMQVNDLTKEAGLSAPDPFEFSRQLIHSRRAARKAGIEVTYSSDLCESPRWTACPVGRDAAIVSPDGSIRSCYLLPEKIEEAGYDFNIGHLEESPVVDANALSRLRQTARSKPGCAECFCRWSCAGGCYVGNRHPAQPIAFCIQTRIITASSILDQLGEFELSRDLAESREFQRQVGDRTSDRLADMELN